VSTAESCTQSATGRTAGDGAALAIFTEAIDCGGTERVVQTLADDFPAAPIVANHFVGLLGPGPDAPAWTDRARLIPSGRRKRHFLGPLYARKLAGARVTPARVVLALSCGGWALAAPVPRGGRLVCYSTGLPPALYGETRLYLQAEATPLRALMLTWLPALRAYYRRLMGRPHRVITVSRSSAKAIEQVWGRTAEVLHPPVRTAFFSPASARRRHFLTVARLVPQKRLDLLLDAFRGIDETLVIAGRGPWLDYLRANAPANVRFTGWVDDATLRELYCSSHALICPSVEEFGIVMAEAHSCGTPVIAPRAGGACDIVDDPATGVLLETFDHRSLRAVLATIGDRRFGPSACRASAERFTEGHFVARIRQVVAEELEAAHESPASV
jgi:glycosyltransferase involved in cell wall biosynthesis